MNENKPTLLITGGCGYIGSHVTRQFSEAGHKVIVVDDLSSGFRDSLLHGEKFYEGNFGDPQLLKTIFAENKIDGILHFAASVKVPESVAKPLLYYRNNTANTISLLEQATAAKLKYFVLSSTAAIYGNAGNEPVIETTPPQPESPYAYSKLMDEWILRDTAAASGLKYIVLRYFNVAGADPEGRIGQRTPEATHLIKIACEVATGKRPKMRVFGTDWPTPDGTGVRDYIHIEDLAAAHLASIKYLTMGGESGLFNCGYGSGYSVREVIAACEKAAGHKIKSEDGPRRAGDIGQVIADSTKIKTTMNWQPKYADLEIITQHALNWESQS